MTKNEGADLSNNTQRIMQKHVEHREKIMKINRKFVKNPSKVDKIRFLGRIGTFSAPFRAQVGSGWAGGVRGRGLLVPFWPKLARQGAILGASPNPKSLKNHIFEHKSALGPSKNDL